MRRLQYFCEWSFAHLCKSIKRRCFALFCLLCAFLFLLRWKLMCINMQPRMHIQKICLSYGSGQSVGSLCQDMCEPDGISSVSCHSFYMEKDTIFSGTWKNQSLVFKTVKETSNSPWESNISENEFLNIVKNNIKIKFNISVDIVDAKRMSYIQYNQKQISRQVEMQNAWSLLQNNEYLALSLYEKYGIFPRLVGSCGSMYAVQKLDSLSAYWHLMTFYDTKEEWERRIKVSIMMLDFLMLLEERLPEPLHLCDVKVSNFGVTNDFKKVMYLDLDSVHPRSVINKITADGSKCKKHSDCDFLDCRSFCNLITNKCQHGVVNNNLQMVCERIFLGWVMSGRVMVPGLLVGPRTPRVLTEMLEKCANPSKEAGTPRARATKEIKLRLYHLLTHLVSS
ncbi:divergent protein kinase domain 1C [Ostrinia nubilalis]|uniref:divergent protein kinase domain 1C n=1 Tax=Ostrinia nubilalis TaxID=29057 RepID=UPI0030823669